MKFIAAVFMALLLHLTLVFPVQAAGEVPVIHGEAAYLLDVQSGEILYSKNGNEELPPASTTKIMTALLALERGNLQDPVIAGPSLLNRQEVYGTQIYLAQGEQLPLKEILYAVLLNSANDAAVAVAEHVGGTLPQFVQMMNDRAAALGMTRTHFVNPTGLNAANHFTTAHDLALLARAAYQNPTFLSYTQTKTHPISRSTPNTPVLMVNENKLLSKDADVNGMKTGYTSQAKNCLVASAERNGRKLVGVILKSPGGEIFGDMQGLLNYGFESFSTSAFIKAETQLSSVQVGKEQVGLILAADIFRTQQLGEAPPSLRLTVTNLRQGLNSVHKGENMGQVEVWEGETILDRVNLVADHNVAQPAKVAPINAAIYLIAAIPTALILMGLNRVFPMRARSKENRQRKGGEPSR